mgnify:CR=1 FL=1
MKGGRPTAYGKIIIWLDRGPETCHNGLGFVIRSSEAVLRGDHDRRLTTNDEHAPSPDAKASASRRQSLGELPFVQFVAEREAIFEGVSMIRRQQGDVRYYTFESLEDSRFVQGVFTRLGGCSEGAFASLNVSVKVGDDPARVAANHATICRALGIRAEDVVTAQQVHGDHVAVVVAGDGGRTYPETDALISNIPGLALMLRFADCVPILLYAPQQGAVALVHAGWQGTLLSIAAKAVRALEAAYGCRPEGIRAGLGPAIGPCCFQVGPEVVAQVQATFDYAERVLSLPQADGKMHWDLWRTNARQLYEAGVTQIEVARVCTRCNHHEWYSHRGENGHTGRFAVVCGLARAATSPNAGL